jgi:hypothetical protein
MTLLDDFKNVLDIGKGEFRAVYKTYDKRLKKYVAIK